MLDKVGVASIKRGSTTVLFLQTTARTKVKMSTVRGKDLR